MFALLVELEAIPALDGELDNVLKTLVGLAETESGIAFYSVHRPQERPNVFVLYELYKDRAAWDAHLQCAPVQQLLKRFDTLLAAPPKITFLDSVVSTALAPA